MPGIPPGRDDAGVNTVTGARHAMQDESAKRAAFAAQLESWRARIELALAARLPHADAVPTRLHQAMRYSVLGGGKRASTMTRPAPPTRISACAGCCGRSRSR